MPKASKQQPNPNTTIEIEEVELFRLRFESAEGTLCERIAIALTEDIDPNDSSLENETQSHLKGTDNE